MKRFIGWIKQIALFAVIAVVMTTAVDLWRGKDLPKENLPNILGTTVQNTSIDVVRMSEDQAVLVYFWGSWCPVCDLVSPAVNTIAKHYPVVTVAMSSGSDAHIRHYLAENDYQFEVLNDSNSAIAREWSVHVTPSLMVFKGGELKHYTTGITSLPGIWWRMIWV